MRILVPLLAVLAAAPLFAQSGRRELTGHVRRGVTAANDRGRANAARVLRQATLVLKPSSRREAELQALLARQQDPSSPDYHQWLSPEEFGDRFGVPQAEIDQITAWLASQNLTVDSVSRGRTTISFSGNVRDVERALQTEIHEYVVDGESHFANATDPSLPTAIGERVRAVRGLDDFRLKPRAKRQTTTPQLAPRYTDRSTGAHYLAPDDMATIFNVSPLYRSGITGKDQKIAVVGQTAIRLTDIQRFRNYFNLPVNDPKVLLVPGEVDPGIYLDDMLEADLDLEWAGAMARDASITYVYSGDVVTSLHYAIDQKLAPIISMSYGICEPAAGFSQLASFKTYADQAAAQGITWIAASGDAGANDCLEVPQAQPGLSVDAPASVPLVTGIGGTTLTEGSGQYWGAKDNANHASALSYIPESVWNDGPGYSGGGGSSTYFEKPAWQKGTGVPADGKRNVPDISLPASGDHDGYLIYNDGAFGIVGGTSAGAPAFAGITALLNQYLLVNGYATSGPLNERLYTLAQKVPGAFHDVTMGDNRAPECAKASCATTLVGYSAGPGFDLATGLGSIDAYNLVLAWPSTGTVVKTPVTVGLSPSLTSLTSTDTTTLTATVTGAGGLAPTGSVSFYASGTLLKVVTLSGSSSAATALISASAAQLGNGDAGQVVLSAVYNGDSAYAGMSAFVTVSVVSSNALALNGITSAASFQKSYAPGMIVSLFGLNLSATTPDPPPAPLPTQLAGTTVTINEINAPLYYVSPTQINVQIPWEVPRDSSAIVKVTTNGQSATDWIKISRFAPQIFGDTNNLMVPYQPTARGSSAFLFATGDGLFGKPQMVTGSVPPSGTVSVPPLNASVFVGGVAAQVLFIGEPSWSVGVSQVNFTIPATAPLGKQAVIVRIGGVSSAPVYITVTE